MAELQTVLQWLGMGIGGCLILVVVVMIVALLGTGGRDWK